MRSTTATIIGATILVVALALLTRPTWADGLSGGSTAGPQLTYAGTTIATPITTTSTDICWVTGSATKIVKINQVLVTGTQTAGTASQHVVFLKRSSVNTGCTAVSSTPFDSVTPVATATMVACSSTSPGLGTLTGNILATHGIFTTAGTPFQSGVSYSWEQYVGNRPTLRGASELLAINFDGTAPTGTSIACHFEWTEE